jgi:hypothetical protein
MTVNDADLRLDGNAAGGLLTEIFRIEMTSVETICAGCGARRPVGALMRYGHEMGAILRCADCDTAVLRVARTRDRLWLDLRGARALRMESAPA